MNIAANRGSKSNRSNVVVAYGSFREAIIQCVREGIRDVSTVEAAMDQLTSVLDEELAEDDDVNSQ